VSPHAGISRSASASACCVGLNGSQSPGPAAARFGAFPAAEAALWLEAHEVEAVARELTLAELFASRAGLEIEVSGRLGFAP
jgi:hypothetical protein